MKVIILGAGQVGRSIATYLAQQNNDVVVVDHEPELLRKLSNAIDVQTILGYASHPETLNRAGCDSADLLIAVTQVDEVNMVACQVAHSLFGIPTKIARIRHKNYLNPLWSDLFRTDNLPIDVIISPEDEVASSIARSLQVDGAFDVIVLGDGLLRVVGVRCTEKSTMVNTPMRHFPNLAPHVALMVACLIRGDQYLFPREDDMLLPGDDVYFLVPAVQVEDAMNLFRQEKTNSRKVVILGGGKIGVRLAEKIQETSPEISTTIIESLRTQAQVIAGLLPKTLVLEGDALDISLLKEAAIHASEAVIVVTDNDKTNILSGLLAKRQGASRVMTLLNDIGYAPLVMSLGIDGVISPKAITVSKVLQHVRRGRICSAHSLREGFGEIIEAEVLETSNIVGMTVDEINKGDPLMVLGLLRGGEYLFPTKDQIIRAKDHVILISKAESVRKVEELFSVRLEYF
jgi:trk system potassium uptake protein TrkA